MGSLRKAALGLIVLSTLMLTACGAVENYVRGLAGVFDAMKSHQKTYDETARLVAAYKALLNVGNYEDNFLSPHKIEETLEKSRKMLASAPNENFLLAWQTTGYLIEQHIELMRKKRELEEQYDWVLAQIQKFYPRKDTKPFVRSGGHIPDKDEVFGIPDKKQ